MSFDSVATVTHADGRDVRLAYERTVERSLVHRAAVGEVFVTDVRGIGQDRYLAGAQLPLAHGYYSDHRHRPARYDTLLLLEACRQASIYGAHRQMGVPVDTTMMVNDWSIELDAAAFPVAGRTPGELELVDTVSARRGRQGDIRALRFDLELWLARRQVGRAHIAVGCATTAQYAALRYMQRGDEPPRTVELAAGQFADRVDAAAGAAVAAAEGGAGRGGAAEHDAVPPVRVGRRDPANVVIADPARDGATLSARVAPRFDNPSLFDHSYDHFPAMVLMEAARQLSLLSVDDGTGAVAARTVASGFDAAFARFAELDAPVIARTTGDGAAGPAVASGPREVVFEQGAATIARAAVTLADTGAPPMAPASAEIGEVPG